MSIKKREKEKENSTPCEFVYKSSSIIIISFLQVFTVNFVVNYLIHRSSVLIIAYLRSQNFHSLISKLQNVAVDTCIPIIKDETTLSHFNELNMIITTNFALRK
jgi:hypothetical protein